ncbi:MAG TPA: methyltransferase domain-containing protein [Candidatus Limnocylindrales bacterium]|nr:methyltransferase domain-containing protein [Candidatus Limnocylindrales bacterium]
MVNKSPDVCPFGPTLQKYWDNRYQYFSRFDDGIQVDEEGLYSVVPETVGMHQASLIQGTTVLDGFVGVGGSTIAFARAGKEVTAVDINPSRLSMAGHNAAIYGVDSNITFIEGDFFDIAQKVKADTVNLDPPWGGPAYKELGRFLFEHFSPNGNELLPFALAHFDEVMIRVPLIFDMSELDRYSKNYDVHDDISNGRVISKTVIIHKQ